MYNLRILRFKFHFIEDSFIMHSPTVLCQRLTANSRLHVTVTAAGMLRWGSVLAAT